MSKKIDTTIVLKDFEGKPIQDEKSIEVTLKSVLLNYLQSANLMGAQTDNEKFSAYNAGLAIGSGGAQTVLEQPQYDVLKKIVDSNKIKSNNQEQEVYRLVVHQQVKKIIDEAETV
jgi:hypothetical protein